MLFRSVLDGGSSCPFPLHSSIVIRSLSIGSFSRRLHRLATRLAAPMRIPRCDVLIFSDCPSAYLGRAAQWLGRVRRPLFFVLSYDPIFFGERHLAWGRPLRRAISAAAYDLRLTYVGCSNFMRELLLAGHGKTAIVANLGVDLTVFHPCRQRSPTAPLLITTVGRSLSAKGLDAFGQAMQIVRRSEPTCRVRVIAFEAIPVPDPSWWEVISQKDDRALAQAYADSVIFVATSLFESFMLSLLEAMACGVPTISTDNRGLHEYAVHGENCLIVSRATPERLAESILLVVRTPDLRQRLVTHGLATASRFPWAQMVKRFEDVLSDGQ